MGKYVYEARDNHAYEGDGEAPICHMIDFVSNDGDSEVIAEAVDAEKAHFLAYYANVAGFIPDALRTLSPAWHGDKVALAHLKGMINGAIDAINKLDKLKKTLFYGRDNNLIAEGQADSMGMLDSLPMPVGANAANVFHAILGKVTEGGELLEALRACWRGNEVFDRINAIEEVGDGFWYDAVLLDEMASDFPDAMNRVIAKLRKRFPDAFTEVNANERDLGAERAVLEGRADEIPGCTHGEFISYPASDIQAIRGLLEEGTQAHGDEFYGRILNILDGKGDDWHPGHEEESGPAPVGTYHGQPVYDPRPAIPAEGIDPEDPRRHHADTVTLTTGDVATTEPGLVRDSFDPDGDNDGGEMLVHAEPSKPPLIVEAETASGSEAVARAAEASAQAFDNLSNVGKPEPEVPTSDLGGELAKSPAARSHPLPQESMAQEHRGLDKGKP